jgi:glycosyltransferase involved in cell wall biosynthesis
MILTTAIEPISTSARGQDAPSAPARPLRVLFALPGLHRVNRGAEVVLEEVAQRAAAEARFAVTVFGSGPARPGQPYRYRKLKGLRREWFEKFPRVPYARDHYMWEELAHAPSLYSNYRPADYDVTVTCGYPYSNWILRRGRKGGHTPAHIFITQNGDWMVRAKNWEYKHFACDGLVCTNPEYYARHRDTYPCALIPNGVDTRQFFPAGCHGQTCLPVSSIKHELNLPPGSHIVLIVSALIPSKRVLDGIRAAAPLADAHLVIAGNGEQREGVDALGRHLLGDRYHRLTLPRERMPDLYRAADVLLHMSQDEPFGNIYIEALATGLPIVAHETPVTRWILEDQGHLVDTGDPAKVTAALRRAIDQNTPDQTSARRALAESRFSWETIARQYCDFFHHVHRIAGTPH